jgi:hypothetical protein
VTIAKRPSEEAGLNRNIPVSTPPSSENSENPKFVRMRCCGMAATAGGGKFRYYGANAKRDHTMLLRAQESLLRIFNPDLLDLTPDRSVEGSYPHTVLR